MNWGGGKNSTFLSQCACKSSIQVMGLGIDFTFTVKKAIQYWFNYCPLL